MMTRRQRSETIYNATQLAEFENIDLSRVDYFNIVDCAERFFRTTGHYDYEDCYFVITEYMKFIGGLQ